MTSPQGQLKKFIKDDEGIKPIYLEHILNKREFSFVEKIWDGIENYIRDFIDILQKIKLIE